jgi:hypothetical protein
MRYRVVIIVDDNSVPSSCSGRDAPFVTGVANEVDTALREYIQRVPHRLLRQTYIESVRHIPFGSPPHVEPET